MCIPIACKRNRKSWFWINAIVFSLYMIGICVWVGLLFIIYYPLMKRDYKEASCTITDLTSFTISATYLVTYHSYGLDIYINNKTYRAYGCISGSSEMMISETVMSMYYPYMYIPCDNSDYISPANSCLDDQLFLPLWACKNSSYAYLTVGSTLNCKWWLADKDGETDPAKSKGITYPAYDNSWIEVLFKDEIYIPPDDYNAMWAIPFALTVCVPLIIIVWINCGIYCCGYSGEFRLLFRYWEAKYIKCKRAKKPYGYYEINNVEMDKKVSTIAFLMALTKGKYASKFPKSLVTKTANYL